MLDSHQALTLSAACLRQIGLLHSIGYNTLMQILEPRVHSPMLLCVYNERS